MTLETIKGIARYRDVSLSEARDYWGASLPRAKWLQPEDIARIVITIMGGGFEYLSGTALDLGGGQR